MDFGKRDYISYAKSIFYTSIEEDIKKKLEGKKY